LLILSLILILTAACAGSSPTLPTAAPLASATAPATPTGQAPAVSPEPVPTGTAPASPTTQPVATAPATPIGGAPDAAADVTRIQVAPGATSASLQGTLAAAGSHRYVLRAAGGQTMTVDLTYPSGEALLIIWGADGDVLISDHAETRHWTGTLPSTQDYYVDVRASAASTTVNYTLQVTIPPAGQEEPQPTRIQFKPGATSATLNGHLAAGAVRRYVLGAMAGQTMTVRLTPASAPAYLVIWGADGSVLLSGNWQSKEYSGVLTLTEDYYVDVHSAGGSAVAYTLQVTIPPAGQEEPQPTRIQFAAGSTSATVKDSVPPGGLKRYVLRAMAGQTMSVELMYPDGEALVAIWGADGDVLLSDHAAARQWSGTLPRTQDYYVDVRAAAGGSAVAYTLLITIPPPGQGEPQASRIQFPAGGTSATVDGHLQPGGVARYVLRAMAGQTMTVRLTPADAPAYLVIWGADGSVLLSGNWQSKEYSGVLTLTEDYYIDVKASGGTGVQYSLWVQIPPP
ncbi:MAG TPA: hypothetical protein VLC95_10810, partial [Anaerolineae bacterium]|nr:hypothetical protein [Anaerolineae bacterium]